MVLGGSNIYIKYLEVYVYYICIMYFVENILWFVVKINIIESYFREFEFSSINVGVFSSIIVIVFEVRNLI